MKFVHAADLHLDSPLTGLPRYEGAPVDELRGATRRALESLVELALREEADFLLLAGDIYDGDWKDYNTGLFFASQMGRLREAEIEVFLIKGNHDAASRISRQLILPKNVQEFSTRRPETRRLEHLGVAVHGQGFAQQRVDTDLSAGYPPPDRGLLNIGLLHTSLDGRPDHHPYAPCSREGLASRGYDYWALGHVHQREAHQVGPCRIVFPGNPQGRHIRETGPRGCCVVTADERGIREVREERLDVLEWTLCDLGAVEAAGPAEAFERWLRGRESAGDRLVAARVVITARERDRGRLERHREAHLSDLRAVAADLGGGRIWLEKLEIRAVPDDTALPLEEELVAGLRRFTEELAGDPDAAAELDRLFQPLRAKLPSVLTQGSDPVALEIAGVLPEARELLLARLQSRPGGAGEVPS